MSNTVTVYSNPGCGPCMVSKRHLKFLSIEFEEKSANDHPEAIALAIDHGNNPAAPNVEICSQSGELVDIWTEHRKTKILVLAG
ncbi:glutaredoxin domain-containing protein [Isoptericola sp. NPDC057191]|uniref:glutaredoxin domain-containing protein n=1 Tax=Isoptericola sp. NPDC057191 TaxID=3346041 RepID=UPI0036346EFF